MQVDMRTNLCYHHIAAKQETRGFVFTKPASPQLHIYGLTQKPRVDGSMSRACLAAVQAFPLARGFCVPRASTDKVRCKMIPTNEMEVIVYFAQAAPSAGFEIVRVQQQFPDAIIKRNDATYRVEFEYRSMGFFTHQHDPRGCDLVICWIDDCPGLIIPVLALSEKDWTTRPIFQLSEKEKEIAYWKERALKAEGLLESGTLPPKRRHAEPEEYVARPAGLFPALSDLEWWADEAWKRKDTTYRTWESAMLPSKRRFNRASYRLLCDELVSAGLAFRGSSNTSIKLGDDVNMIKQKVAQLWREWAAQ